MRIVSGELKGRNISAPDGGTTRPTSDRARESIFNVLAHAEWAQDLDGARVIDAFAGSGALGLEAISRGAAFCLFVETNSSARGAIRENVEALGLFGKTRIHRRSAVDLGTKPASAGDPFDLVFLDPPYGYDLVPKALASLQRGGWLTTGALAIAECAIAEPTVTSEKWKLLDEREYGAARISFLSYLGD